MKKYIIFFGLVLLLTSCGSGIEPNINGNNNTGNSKIDNLNENDELYLSDGVDYKSNVAIKEEIEDRQKSYDKVNQNKQYLLEVSNNLTTKIETFKEHIEITRQLIVVDVKIVNAILDGYLEEKAINKNNYFYKMLQSMDEDERKEVIANLDNIINIIGDEKKFNQLYYTNFDLSNIDSFDNNTKAIYDYTNFYLKHVKFNLNVKSNLTLIIKSYNVLKIDKFGLKQGKSGFMKKGSEMIFYKSTLKNLEKDLLNK